MPNNHRLRRGHVAPAVRCFLLPSGFTDVTSGDGSAGVAVYNALCLLARKEEPQDILTALLFGGVCRAPQLAAISY